MVRGRLLEMTRPPSSRAWARVDDPDAATFLVEPANRRYLGPFLAAEASVAEAAASLGVELDDVYYRVRRMTALGILSVARSQPRAGRPIKYYTAVGERLFVPFAATPAATLQELVLETNASMDDRLVRGLLSTTWELIDDLERWGFRVFKDSDDRLHVDYAPEDAPDDWDLHRYLLHHDAPALLSSWDEMGLAAADAKALQHDLFELVERYRAAAVRTDAPTTTYLVRIALAPIRTKGEP
jgi:hypothetical protein